MAESLVYDPALVARVVKLVDTRDLKSLDFGCAGSSPAPGTIKNQSLNAEMCWGFFVLLSCGIKPQ